jgi:hypothetical protein
MKLSLAATIGIAALMGKEAAAQQASGQKSVCLLSCPDPNKFMDPLYVRTWKELTMTLACHLRVGIRRLALLQRSI